MSLDRDTPAAIGTVSAAELVARFGGTLLGDGAVALRRIAPLPRAAADELAFLSQASAAAQLRGTAAGCVIVPPACVEPAGALRAAIVTPDPYLYYARVARREPLRGACVIQVGVGSDDGRAQRSGLLRASRRHDHAAGGGVAQLRAGRGLTEKSEIVGAGALQRCDTAQGHRAIAQQRAAEARDEIGHTDRSRCRRCAALGAHLVDASSAFRTLSVMSMRGLT